MKRRLELVEIASPCEVPWISMRGDERVRFCGTCKKNVYNVAGMSRDEAEALIGESTQLCLRLMKRADGTVITSDCAPARAQALRKAARRGLYFAVAMAGAIGGLLGTAGWALSGEPLCESTTRSNGLFTRVAQALSDKLEEPHYAMPAGGPPPEYYDPPHVRRPR
jgi:hypothetical protein